MMVFTKCKCGSIWHLNAEPLPSVLSHCWLLEGHPASNKTGCWFVGGDDLTGALHVL